MTIRNYVWCSGGLLVLFVVILFFANIRTVPTLKTSDVEITQVSPESLPARGKPKEQIEFIYKISNKSSSVLDGLSIASNCKCSIVIDIPSTIAPKASAEFRLRMSVPPTGHSTERFRINSNEGVIWNGTMEIIAESSPPYIVSQNTLALLTFVNGVPRSANVVLETYESKTHEDWILGATTHCDYVECRDICTLG